MAEDAVLAAIETGYRAIDTAQIYRNEAAVGRALKAAGVEQDSLCITTKVTPANYTAERFRPSVEQSLADLGLNSVDILLLHWPPPDGTLASCLEWLQDVHAQGLARSIGVSNFTIRMLEEARTQLEVPLVTSQVEFHPLLDQSRLMQAALRTGFGSVRVHRRGLCVPGQRRGWGETGKRLARVRRAGNPRLCADPDCLTAPARGRIGNWWRTPQSVGQLLSLVCQLNAGGRVVNSTPQPAGAGKANDPVSPG